jgi:hypothetical protein
MINYLLITILICETLKTMKIMKKYFKDIRYEQSILLFFKFFKLTNIFE